MIYAGRCYKIIAVCGFCGMSYFRMDDNRKSKNVGLHVLWFVLYFSC